MPAPARRYPAVAGQFYPATRRALELEVDRCLGPSKPETTFDGALACLVPHAGYTYSGGVAGAVFGRLPPRGSYVILGPNHYGVGSPLATVISGEWLTPLGAVSLDEALGRAVSTALPALVEDPEAHSQEHSLEVELPFLQRSGHAFRFLPIAIGAVAYEQLDKLGHALAVAVRSAPEPVLIVASSDLNHYQSDTVTRVKDGKAIERILALDPLGLYETVRVERISMCGIGPAVAMLVAANDLGAQRAELVRYGTSADTGGPPDRVVGYAGIVVTQN